jgi:pimeloyl-ACP methyl ester carboxylesterase
MTSSYADPACALDDHPQPRQSRLSGELCIEHTVNTSDGVCLAVRDYQPTTAVQHTVVLLHGLCLTYTSWHNQIRRLHRQPGVRIIAYDHRGHGRSTTAPLRTYTIEQLAGDLADVLTDLAVAGPVTLAGHSMGGMCALAYLARANQPVAPAGLVLVATAAGDLSDHGLGRLLSTPGLDSLADIVDHAPRHATEHALRALAKPVCAALARHRGYDTDDRTTLAAAVADTLHTTPWTTAVGFLRALSLDPPMWKGCGWVVKAKCPVVVEE